MRSQGKVTKALYMCAVALALCFGGAGSLFAAERELPTPRAALDVVLLFDASGSMLKTDPNDLRYEGAKLLLSFLGEGDRIAVVSFAGTSGVVRDLEPFSQSGSAELVAKIKGIKPEGPFSDLAEGLKAAKKLLETRARSEAQRVIVLLSDGKMEPDPAVSPAFARTLELVHDVLPELKAKETKVFTLAFSEQADRPFLAEIAAATDGLTWFTASSQDIHKSFADLFLAIKRPQIVSQTSRGFKIDEDVEEATFYINREPGSVVGLIAPKGEEYSAGRHPEHVMWFSAQNFDVVTIAEPDAGDWQVIGSSTNDGFATVLTDLKLLTDWPLVVRAGDEPLVQARLYEEDKPVSLPEMSGVITYGFQVIPTDKVSQPIIQEEMRDDGKGADKVALDGIFSAISHIKEPGEYKLTVVAKGPTFQRSQQIPFTVRQRLVKLDVRSEAEVDEHESRDNHDKAESKEHDDALEGDDRAEFVVKLSKEALSFREYEITLVALSSDRQKTEIPMKRSSGSGLEFSVSAAKLPAAGSYSLKAVLHGRTKKEQEVEAVSPSVDFIFSPREVTPEPTGAQHEAAHNEVEEEKPEDRSLPVFPIAATVVIGVGVLGVLYFLSKPAKTRGGSALQKYLPHKQLIDAIATLEERTSATKVELNDPIFGVVEAQRTSGDQSTPQDAPAEAASEGEQGV